MSVRAPARPLATLLLLGACGGGEPAREPAQPLNLIVVSLDTLRADRLGCYGYARDTSPAIDRLAAGSVRFEHAYAESSWTIPSHFTLLTGLLPGTHGVTRPDRRPGADVRLLPELLREHGYYTFALTDGGWMSREQGFARGFDSFHARRDKILDDRRGGFEATLEDAREFVRFRHGQGPFFGLLHTYDVHCPYDPPEPYRSMFVTPGREELDADGKCGATAFNRMDLSPSQAAYLSDRYDGGVRWVDDMLAGFLDFLEEQGVLDDTVVVVLSDHGEEFLEHGAIGHERTLHVEALHVPLIVRAPGLAPRVVDTPVGLVDVLPTVLELLGLPPAEDLDGRSLVPLLRGGDGAGFPEHRLAELSWLADLECLVGPEEHLIVDRASGAELYYDLARDPRATRPLPDDPRRAVLREELERLRAELAGRRRAAERRAALSEEERADLRGLGYAED